MVKSREKAVFNLQRSWRLVRAASSMARDVRLAGLSALLRERQRAELRSMKRKLDEARSADEVSAEFRARLEGEQLYQDAQRKHTVRDAAEYLAKPVLNECDCTWYAGKEDCRHTRIYKDRVAWFMAGATWQRDQGASLTQDVWFLIKEAKQFDHTDHDFQDRDPLHCIRCAADGALESIKPREGEENNG